MTEVAASARHHRAGVLLRAHHPVRIAAVGRDVVDLRNRDWIPEAPGLSAVELDSRSLIPAGEHALAVAGIDPHHVVVLASGRALERLESGPAVGRSHQRDA